MPSDPGPTDSPIQRLIGIMVRLRDPAEGCPWDREQTFRTIAPYTIEEAYEVAEAIEHDDMAALRDELGDLLFQVVFHARMAEEAGAFDFDLVVQSLCEKMVRRHPHVFAGADIRDAGQQTAAWEAHKAAERAARAQADSRPPGALDDVTPALPALTRAYKLQQRAARVGFDWSDSAGPRAKVDEELAELGHEMGQPDPVPERLSEEFGDLLFAMVNLGRHLGIDPESAARHANAKFERRFRQMEILLARQGRSPADATLAEMDELWNLAKKDDPS